MPSSIPLDLASTLSDLTNRLEDVADLPPQQELARWLMASQVGTILLIFLLLSHYLAY